MRRGSFCLTIIGLVFIWGLFSSFDYAKEWKSVDKLMETKPKSALSRVDAIEKRAKAEKNISQQIRCIITRGNAKSCISDSAFVDCLGELKQIQQRTKDDVSRSVVTYVIGKMCMKYYHRHYYDIDARTDLGDYVPEDIMEWTSNIFVDKIREYIFSALSNEKLKGVPAIKYEAILQKGEDSRIYRPTLYDLLLSDLLQGRYGEEIISAEEKEKFLRERVAFHANDKTRDAYVQAKLELMQFLYEKKDNRTSFVSELEAFLEEVKNDRASILVRDALCKELGRGCSRVSEDSELPQRLVDICEEGIKAFPKHSKIDRLKNMVEAMNHPKFHISMENTRVHTSDTVRLRIRYANLRNVKLNLSRLDVSSASEYWAMRRDKIGKDKNFPTQTFSYDLPKTNYCVLRDTILEIPAPDFGMYRVELGSDPQEGEAIDFEVTNLFYLRTTSLQETRDVVRNYVVVDAKNGAPRPNVRLTARKKKDDEGSVILARAFTDSSGFSGITFFTIPYYRYAGTYFEDGDDRFLSPDLSSYGTGYSEFSNVGGHVAILTDRSIYRPSQTVYFKVICYGIKKHNCIRLGANIGLNVIFYDANGQVIAKQSLKTNEFGSIASSFVIPASGLSGDYKIEVDEGSPLGGNLKTIRVEEYKRPTFEVKMPRPTNVFSFGDSIKVKGRADYLLGTPASGAKVEYSVVRTPCSWWRLSKYDETVAEGTCEVAEDGSFDIPFLAQKEARDTGFSYYHFEIRVKVTDMSGETHEEVVSLSVGDRSLFFSTDSQKRVLIDDFPSKLYNIANLNDEGQVVNVSYDVLHDGVPVATGNVLSDEKGAFTLNVDPKEWLSGAYTVNLKALDEKGGEVTASYELVLYRKDDKRPPVHTFLWTENVRNVSLPYGEEYTVRVGSSLKDAHLFMLVNDEQGEVERRWINLNNEIKDFSFKLEEKNGENLNVNFFIVNEGICYESHFTISVRWESKPLPIKLSVFRDKMQPGSKETWTLTLPKKKQAEVLVAMYDASLDQLLPHAWSFNPVYRRWFRFPSWYRCRPTDGASFSHYWPFRINEVKWMFDEFIELPDGDRWYPHSSSPTILCCENSESPVAYKVSYKNVEAEESEDDDDMMSQEKDVTNDDAGRAHKNKKEDASKLKVRKNFSETAFFYPQLRTDKKGNVRFSFKMPESLTRWNFKALAHTKDLFFGQMSDQMVTQKDFMISPNLPRFLRKGDRCVLSAKVINLSESAIKGTALMELLDPVTEKVVAKLNAQFSVEAGKNTAATWTFDVPRDRDAVLVRTSAVAGNFSDAEQTLLPILSDRMVVTQSLPLYVRGGQTKNYTFDNLVNNQSTTLSSRFLKLEFAKDPIWYAVQALPSVASVEHENAVSYSAAHFASLLSHHIAKSNPKILNVINAWKQQGLDKQTLLSNLEKNQDVKNILQNESPWVMEAKDETEMKQRLSTLFDVNDLQNKCTLWFDKLMDFRLESGAYSWFKSIYPSTHTTLFVLDNLGRLRKEGIANDALLQKARYDASIRYLDNELREKYEYLKKHHPKDYKEVAYVGMTDLYYFQVRSLFPEVEMYDSDKEAFAFYYGLAKDSWKEFSLYGKALATIAFYRGGDKELAKTIVESLREFSTTTDEMGMFWQKNTSGYLWSDAAVSTHTRIMEALEVVDPKVQEQDEMRLWLLNQKRTQNWDNTIANVDALNVLLLSGSDWLSNDNQVTIKLGGKAVQPEKAEAGTGYFTEYIKGNDVKPSMGHVELKSEAGGNISWGALYWQFEEDIDKVWKNKTALHVEKMVMLEVRENGKSVLKQINEGTKLSVGDKLVVRLTLRTDRDMDYVSLKDQRASCLEPTQQLSGYRCSEGTCYYQSPKDAAMYYFFDHLSKGTYVFEYPLWVTHAGDYCNGITTAQCLYAPEFLTNTGSVRIRVQSEQ